ncbi:hypothetical protein EB052_02195, partial [bacterium]|nr:hypothetical protein [bacterium]
QKIATRVFIYSSITFGVIGILMILTEGPHGDVSAFGEILHKLLMITVCIILPSFALSVAGKYLNGEI